MYSFQDVLALRTFVRLREHASLQKIRGAIGNLRDIGEVGHLASYRLVSDKRGNVQLVTEDQAVNLGERPGQLQLVAIIGEIIEPFAARAGVLVPHLLRPRPGLSVDPETQGGTPVIIGTRVPYDAVAGLMRDGVPADRIAEYYPAVGADAASDALDFARYVDSFGAQRARRPARPRMPVTNPGRYRADAWAALIDCSAAATTLGWRPLLT